MQTNKLLSTALMMSLMMSGSVFNLVYAQDAEQSGAGAPQSQSENGGQQGQEQQQSANGASSGEVVVQNPEEYQEEYQGMGSTGTEDNGGALQYDSGYPTASSGSSYDAGFYAEDVNTATELSESMNGTVDVNNTETSSASSGGELEIIDELEHSYPTFTSEEMNEVFNVSDVAENENSLAVEPIEDEEKPKKLEYLEEAAAVYRALPTDPVYTYGQDESGGSVCVAATEEFCEKSAEFYKSYAAKIEANESITITDPDAGNFGALIQPEAYRKDVSAMPNVADGICSCPDGYTARDDPNYGGLHCGKIWGINGKQYHRRNCS